VIGSHYPIKHNEKTVIQKVYWMKQTGDTSMVPEPVLYDTRTSIIWYNALFVAFASLPVHTH
jgi:hypothetical protein